MKLVKILVTAIIVVVLLAALYVLGHRLLVLTGDFGYSILESLKHLFSDGLAALFEGGKALAP